MQTTEYLVHNIVESVSVLQSVCYVITLFEHKHGSTSHSKTFPNVFYDKFEEKLKQNQWDHMQG